MKAYIKALTYALPKKALTNEQLVEEFPEWSVDKIANKVGIHTRHIADENETAADLAVRAAEKLFATETNINRNEIDFILFCTQSPDYFLPTSACLIQDKLGLPTTCGALDFNLGCSGYIYGLSLAKGLIMGGIAKNVLFLTGETYTKHLHPKDKGNRTIFGDAGSATLISTEGFAEIGNFSLGTDGKGAENLIVKTGAFKHKSPLNDLNFDEKANPTSSDYLFMNGSEIFNFTIDVVPSLVNYTLDKNELTKEDVDGYVFHQANAFMLNFLRKKLKIEEEKFHYYMSEVGNTVSSTIPIVLYEKLKENKLKGNLLLAGFGVGYSWGGCILKTN
ncbi:ketoacyl-ACP synthase III [Capnocytophaga sp. 051621]|uniref:Ketoacyl-ACP synthase III n=2 Tax=Capnocytophaga TaxID=1016 RepID=A0ABS1YZP2_9FLAO|nr:MULTISPECIES: ketoacyl-ACP synthase III [Capnocytophaga]MBI1647721.1 ketoacyl-ACP synthase III [Capnocytophaga periodontitidis]MBM0651455.1 ketoacyl-ACP synthase III [Capnocytophaga genosp. AHN8471]MBM0662943.1 ketoacyl-ACP synthase III [Capnocytophaga genosp. AHN8471]